MIYGNQVDAVTCPPCHLGFNCISDKWPSKDRRELVEVNLFDVSVVTYPAYPQTSVSARSADGNKPVIGWYSGELVSVADPEIDDRERLRLMLQLAQRIK